MSGDGPPRYLDANQIVYLPAWARYAVMVVLGALALSACIAGLAFFFFPANYDKITPTLSIAQTAAGAFALVLFVLFAERELSTEKLLRKTDVFLEQQMADGLRKIEIPQLRPGVTVDVDVVQRASTVHGGRKDIFGANYEIRLGEFKMRMWVGINVKRLSVIYFVNAADESAVDFYEEKFHFTFAGAAKLGYDTNFQYAEINGERFVSIWSTVMADKVILGNPSEQLFWIQDVAMMTQSFIRTAVRERLDAYTSIEPGPL
ncbi:hypothetical protein [Massilia sp. BSC265]|uniref:hypothetical protein n=1 Tax=Massilia sp. BSC265 TaxID=1549812 RepID=UPI0004E94BFE|nr:hypothetical protein [Massilia sp. BSC265]KFI07975.1 hypothetical protein JN27_06965 [Massilia sp. BSC265]